MLAAAIGIYRAIEADVGRLVEGEDRPGPFLGDGGAQPGWIAVQRHHVITPVAVEFARRQPIALRHQCALRAATGDGGFESAFHRQNIAGT